MAEMGPLAILNGAVADHPAVRAWRQLDRARGEPVAVEVWRERPRFGPASIYRLIFKDGDSSGVYAKRAPRSDMTVERTIYEAVLPRLPVMSPEYYGSLDESDGTCWIFLEDVGSEPFSPRNPEHRALAARWVARLHRLGVGVEEARGLPEAGPGRYLQLLRLGRDRILPGLGNPALRQGDGEILEAVLSLLEHVESRWEEFEGPCRRLPATLVHGDFRPKNVRIQAGETGPTLVALDWELAGWGVPVRDLAPARGTELSMQLDLDVYRSEVGADWPQLDAATTYRLSLLGNLFHGLAAIEWESLELHIEDPACLSRPLASLRVLTQTIWRGLTADAGSGP